MSAIITDQLRILNASNFLTQITDPSNSFYTFVGLVNPFDYNRDWDVNPPSPKDSFEQENTAWDNMVALKKIRGEDVKQVIRKIDWISGVIYDRYRNNIDRDNLANQTSATSLYSSNYYVVTSDFRVYICLENGEDPENPNGKPSLDEPRFTDLEPRSAGNSGDGYVWKYLYTINPSDVIKFDSTQYIPVPRNWSSNNDVAIIRENAFDGGQLKTVIVKDRGEGLGLPNRVYSRIPIKGDGIGAEATIIVNNDSRVERVVISNGGRGYTFGRLDLLSGGFPIEDAIRIPRFEVVIPPKNGHGADIYRELGATSILIYSRIENDEQNPDFIIGNQISQIGIIANPLAFNSNETLNTDKASAVGAIKLGVGFDEATFNSDSFITQTIGIGKTSVARVVSYDKTTGILKYWRDKTNYGFDFNGNQNTPQYGFEQFEFTFEPEIGGNINIVGELSTVPIDTNFGTSLEPGISTTINSRTYFTGQPFVGGLSNPEVKKYSGDIVYIDNRPPITRSQNQKEDIKVILQF
jgi:hypothetical protein